MNNAHSNESTNILIVGVGGQGIILSSEVLASACLEAGYDVKQSEVHGMAQRGGSVTSHVRFGKKVYAPTIERGTAHILLAFELLEGMRWLDYLAVDGKAVINRQRIDPLTVASGMAEYPAGIEDTIRESRPDSVFVSGLELAQEAGNLRAVNVVLLGTLSSYLDIPLAIWEHCIQKRVPPKTIGINMSAFEKGRNIIRHRDAT